MIPAQRKPQHDEPRAEDARPVRIAYSATVTQYGCNQAGDGFRTHQATVSVTGGPR
jgi:hypothetical protein